MIVRLLIAPLAMALLRRRLRRAGGTDGLGWAARVPLVTLPALALLAIAALGAPRPRLSRGRPRRGPRGRAAGR